MSLITCLTADRLVADRLASRSHMSRGVFVVPSTEWMVWTSLSFKFGTPLELMGRLIDYKTAGLFDWQTSSSLRG